MRDPKGDDGRLRQFPNYQKKLEEYIEAERCNSYHYNEVSSIHHVQYRYSKLTSWKAIDVMGSERCFLIALHLIILCSS